MSITISYWEMKPLEPSEKPSGLERVDEGLTTRGKVWWFPYFD